MGREVAPRGRAHGLRMALALLGALGACTPPAAPVPPPPVPSASLAPVPAPPAGMRGEPILEGEPRPEVKQVVLSPAGSRVALRLGARRVEVWDVAQGTRLADREMASPVGSMVFAPGAQSLQADGEKLAWTAAAEESVPVPTPRVPTAADVAAADKWARKLGGEAKLESGKLLVQPTQAGTTKFVLAPSGAAVAAVLDQEAVSVLSLEQGATWQARRFVTGFSRHGGGAPGLIDVRFGPRADRAMLVSWSIFGAQERGEGRLVDTATGRVIASLQGMCPPYDIGWSDGGGVVFQHGCMTGSEMLDTESGRSIPLPPGEIVAVDAAARTVAMEARGIRVHRLEDGRETLLLAPQAVYGASLVRGGSRLLATGPSTVEVWAVDRGERALSISLPDVTYLALDRAQRVAVVGVPSGFHVVDLVEPASRGPFGEGRLLAVAPAGDAVLLSKDRRLRVYDLQGKLRFDTELVVAGRRVVVTHATLGGDRVYVATTAGDLVVLSALDGKTTASRAALWKQQVSSLVASPDGARVAAGVDTQDSTNIEVYTADLRRIAAFEPATWTPAWSDDSALLFTQDWNRIVTRNANDGSIAAEMPIPSGMRGELAFSLVRRGVTEPVALRRILRDVPETMDITSVSPESGLRVVAFQRYTGDPAASLEGIRLLHADGRLLRLVSRRLGASEGWAVFDAEGPYDASDSLLPRVRVRAEGGTIGQPLASARVPRLLAELWSSRRPIQASTTP